jgi:hypothetical protein
LGEFVNTEEVAVAHLVWTRFDNNNLFDDPLNWAPVTGPNSTSDCLIAPSSPVTINAGTTTINSLFTNADATLSIAAGAAFTLLGAPDTTNPTGASTNGGILNTAAGSDFSVNGTFTNNDLVLQYGNFTVGASHMGTVVNNPGCNWFIAGAADISSGGAALSSFTNGGTLARTGAGVTDVSVATLNTGQVEAVAVNGPGGKLEFSSPVANFGTMTAAGAVLQLDRPVSGTGGELDINTGGTVNIVRGSDSGQTVDFLPSLGTERLMLGSAGTFAGYISGFIGHDLIDLVHTSANIAAYNPFNGVLTLFENSTNSTPVANLHLNGSYTGIYTSSDFHLTTTATGTQISFV